MSFESPHERSIRGHRASSSGNLLSTADTVLRSRVEAESDARSKSRNRSPQSQREQQPAVAGRSSAVSWSYYLKLLLLTLVCFVFAYVCVVLMHNNFQHIYLNAKNALSSLRGCDSQIKALTDFKFEADLSAKLHARSSTHTTGSFSYSPRQWMDPNGAWTYSKFEQEFVRIRDSNFKDFISHSTGASDYMQDLRRKELLDSTEEDRLQSILKKLVEYSKKTYSLPALSKQLEESSSEYNKLVEAYRKSKADVELHRRRIEDLLRSEQIDRSQVEDAEKKLSELQLRLSQLNEEINRKNRDLNERLSSVQIKIREAESIIGDNKKISDTNEERGHKIVAWQREVEQFTAQIREADSDRTTLLGSLRDLNESIAEHRVNKNNLESSRSTLTSVIQNHYNNKEEYELVKSLGGCEKNKIETLVSRIHKKIDLQESIKQITNDEEILVEVRKDQKIVEDIRESYEQLKRRAQEFELKNMEKHIHKYESMLSEVRAQIAQVDGKIANCSQQISQLRVRLGSLESLIVDKEARISLNKRLIVESQNQIARDSERLRPELAVASDLIKQRDELREELTLSVGSLQKQKESLEESLRLQQSSLQNLQAKRRNFRPELSEHFSKLNLEMNNSKRQELQVDAYKRDIEVVQQLYSSHTDELNGIKASLASLLSSIGAIN